MGRPARARRPCPSCSSSRSGRRLRLATARIDIAIAEAQIEQTWARHDWILGAQLQTSRARNFASRISWTTTVAADLARTLPTGGTASLHAGTQYGEAFRSTAFEKVWSDDVSVSFTQPLLRGRGRSVFEANERRAVAVARRRRARAPARRDPARCRPWSRRTGTSCSPSAQVAITQSSLDLASERLRDHPDRRRTAARSRTPRSPRSSRSSRPARRTCSTASSRCSIARSRCAARSACRSARASSACACRPISTPGTAAGTSRQLARARLRRQPRARAAREAGRQRERSRSRSPRTACLPQLDAALTLGPMRPGRQRSATRGRTPSKLNELRSAGSLTLPQLDRPARRPRPRPRAARPRARSSRSTRSTSARRSRRRMARAVAQLELARRRVDAVAARDRAREREHQDRDRPLQPRQVDELRRPQPLRTSSGRPSCARRRR